MGGSAHSTTWCVRLGAELPGAQRRLVGGVSSAPFYRRCTSARPAVINGLHAPTPRLQEIFWKRLQESEAAGQPPEVRNTAGCHQAGGRAAGGGRCAAACQAAFARCTDAHPYCLACVSACQAAFARCTDAIPTAWPAFQPAKLHSSGAPITHFCCLCWRLRPADAGGAGAQHQEADDCPGGVQLLWWVGSW